MNYSVTFGGVEGRIQLMSRTRVQAEIPEDAQAGPVKITHKNKTGAEIDFNTVRRIEVTVNPVDSPLYDEEGNLYVTFSGKRGETTPISVYKITPEGEATPYITNIPNATSLAIDKEGNLFVSSRFEGTVYKVTPQADTTVFARDLGVPTGLAFDNKGQLFVGDRAGRILKVSPKGDVSVFAEIPESMVAFHLLFDLEDNLLVSNPALSSNNHILMIDKFGKSIPVYGGFGRPQGMALDKQGNFYLCEAKIGDSGIYKFLPDGTATKIVTGPVMVGLAFDAHGNMAVACPNAIYVFTQKLKV